MSLSDNPIPLRLKPSRHFPFLARHPWVHAHALAETGDSLDCGQVVDLLDFEGNWVARGVINPNSRLRIRLYVFDANLAIDEALWKSRIDDAIARRRLVGPIDRDAAERVVFSESDLLSGLIVDRYADCLGVQFTAGALTRWQQPILEHLRTAFSARAIMVRMDDKTAKYEGLEAQEQWFEGVAIDEPVLYRQNELQWAVDLRGGQKTGGYLDQRLNHQASAVYMRGRNVLDVCCYNGGFGLAALREGAASVVGIDSSAPALDQARQTLVRNGLDGESFGEISFRLGDCFDELKKLGEQAETFDAVILDPPRFAGSRHQLDTALRAYRRLNAMAVDLLSPGGVLVTCSCSGRVSRSEFLNMLLDVGRRRRRDLIVLENRGPAPDHPIAISCPESDYLKCVIAQVQ
ncbi:class I SAM-dependent rRNA methyltransferase [Novipirellula artificiosorum]|uniref:Ribosomal RNA large subunit methyltransferase I n=1 Tax=Novipirellula artificiosorum TaxID=2528016 RepID=A0A5C6D640_9BACT|nr:class I SAM-dependent rRNA methyltransferase [Novipirellula artificiosorum]TWU31525.1 Ribosomal RNA large subunit methyltransferase I [Novipirellula artificiosorum]